MPFLWSKWQRAFQISEADLDYEISYWRTSDGDVAALRTFCDDYPEARACLLYGGTQRYKFGPIDVLPLAEALKQLPHRLS